MSNFLTQQYYKEFHSLTLQFTNKIFIPDFMYIILIVKLSQEYNSFKYVTLRINYVSLTLVTLLTEVLCIGRVCVTVMISSKKINMYLICNYVMFFYDTNDIRWKYLGSLLEW